MDSLILQRHFVASPSFTTPVSYVCLTTQHGKTAVYPRHHFVQLPNNPLLKPHFYKHDLRVKEAVIPRYNNDNGLCQTCFLRWHKALGKGLAKGGYGSMDANTAIGTTESDCLCL